MTRTLVAAAALALAALPAAAQEKSFKVGVVNLRTCFDKEKVERVKDVDAELQKMAEDFAKKLQDIEKEMERLQEQIKGLPLGSKLRQEKLAQLKRREADVKIERDLGKSLYLDFYGDKKVEIYNEIRRVVDLVAKELKLDLVLRVEPSLLDEQDNETVTQRINTRVVLHYGENMDITPQVLERLNAEYRKAKAAAGTGEKK